MKFHHLLIAFFLIFSSSNAYANKPAVQADPAPTANATAQNNLDLLQEGQAAFNARDYEKAFRLWHGLAQQGHIEAQVFVGLAYKNGWGVAKNAQQASMWFQMAAEGGNPSAQFFIGLHYLSSDKPEMVDVGINWLVQAARNGETSARQFLLKAKRRNWFPVPDNFEISTTVTQVTADNIKQVFPESAKAQAPQQSLQSSLQQAQAQFEQATPPAVHPSTVQ